MATPFEFAARELAAYLPAAHLSPYPDAGVAPRPLYYDDAPTEFGHLSQRYPCYYPARLTQPGRPPLTLRLAASADALNIYARLGHPSRPFLTHYGYWRIEQRPNPADTDFWLLVLLAEPTIQTLILPTARLRQLLDHAHNPEKFTLLLPTVGPCFAGQTLTAAARLVVLQTPALLDTPAYRGLRLDYYLNNWQQLAAP